MKKINGETVEIDELVKGTNRLKKLNNEAVDKDGNLSSYNIPQWKYLLDASFDMSHICCGVMKKKHLKVLFKFIDISAVVLAVIAFIAAMVCVCIYDYKDLTPLRVLAVSVAYLIFFAWANWGSDYE